MAITKKYRKQTPPPNGLQDEAKWNKEKNNLKKLSQMLFYDIQRLESLFCLDVKCTIDFFEEVRRFEINLIKTALLCTNGSQRRCAKLLATTPSNLNNKIKKYKITIKS